MSAIFILFAAVLFLIGIVNLIKMLRNKHFWFGLLYQILLVILINALGFFLNSLNIPLKQNAFFLVSYVLLFEILLLNISKDSLLPIKFLFSLITLGLFTFLIGAGKGAHIYNPNTELGEDDDPRLNRLYVRGMMDISIFWISWSILFIYWGNIYQPFYLGLINSILCFLIGLTCFRKGRRKATLPISKYISWISVVVCLIFIFAITNIPSLNGNMNDNEKKMVSTAQNIMQNK